MHLPRPHKIDHAFLNRKRYEIYYMLARAFRKVYQMLDSMIMGYPKMRIAAEISFKPVGIQQVIVRFVGNKVMNIESGIYGFCHYLCFACTKIPHITGVLWKISWLLWYYLLIIEKYRE